MQTLWSQFYSYLSLPMGVKGGINYTIKGYIDVLQVEGLKNDMTTRVVGPIAAMDVQQCCLCNFLCSYIDENNY